MNMRVFGAVVESTFQSVTEINLSVSRLFYQLTSSFGQKAVSLSKCNQKLFPKIIQNLNTKEKKQQPYYLDWDQLRPWDESVITISG